MCLWVLVGPKNNKLAGTDLNPSIRIQILNKLKATTQLHWPGTWIHLPSLFRTNNKQLHWAFGISNLSIRRRIKIIEKGDYWPAFVLLMTKWSTTLTELTGSVPEAAFHLLGNLLWWLSCLGCLISASQSGSSFQLFGTCPAEHSKMRWFFWVLRNVCIKQSRNMRFWNVPLAQDID